MGLCKKNGSDNTWRYQTRMRWSCLIHLLIQACCACVRRGGSGGGAPCDASTAMGYDGRSIFRSREVRRETSSLLAMICNDFDADVAGEFGDAGSGKDEVIGVERGGSGGGAGRDGDGARGAILSGSTFLSSLRGSVS